MCESPRGGVLLSKIPGSRDFFCNLQFSNRASLVMLGKAPLSGDYAVDLGFRSCVPQQNPLTGVPYPILRHVSGRVEIEGEKFSDKNTCTTRIWGWTCCNTCSMSKYHNPCQLSPWLYPTLQ